MTLRSRRERPRQPLDREVEAEQGHDRDEPAPQRGVLADHRVLDGVADDQDDDQLEDRHLADLALAGQPDRRDEEQVDDRGPEDDLGQAGADVGQAGHGRSTVATTIDA